MKIQQTTPQNTAYIIDSYRHDNKVILWIKEKSGTTYKNTRIEKTFTTEIYAELDAGSFLKRRNIPHHVTEKLTYLQKRKKVFAIPVDNIMKYESFIRDIERRTKNRIILYNADIPPEQMFLYEHDFRPGMPITINNDRISPVEKPEDQQSIYLTRCILHFDRESKRISKLYLDDKTFEGEEKFLLISFLKAFTTLDPDAIIMEHAFSQLPILDARIRHHNLEPQFHRWDTTPITYRGGKPFFSYGRVIYRDFAIRLKGRLLIDSSSTIGEECDVDGILELCRLTGARFQQVASRSFGAAFQHSLVRLLCQNDYLVPHKEKPVDIPITMLDMLKGDAGGHRLDPKVGFHKDVAEIDFTSMFPFIIHNKNISAETILGGAPPYMTVPGLPIKISHDKKGIVPQAIKPILDRRMEYKRNPTTLNVSRAKALKFVLVTAYGYLRFREFKLGLASSHMAICAYAREILLQSARLAEARGFRVIHGIVDSLFIQKKGITEEEVSDFCRELQEIVGIPIELEGILKWVVFLPSINDPYRPLPSTYYGIFRSGKMKARGIEVRQRKSPEVVKVFQRKVIEEMANCSSKRDVLAQLDKFCQLLRLTASNLDTLSPDTLSHNIRLSKDNYRNNIPQKKIIAQLKRRSIKVYPGQTISYLIQRGNRPCIPEAYRGHPDMHYYRNLLERSLFNILQPFGVTRELISELSGSETQMRITDYQRQVKQVMIPVKKGRPRKGLSELTVRRRLERAGWIVWRGGLFGITKREENYPNVQRKYELLNSIMDRHHPGKREYLEYLCSVHHGMPDFIAFRNSQFKFVECKLGYESLSKRQIRCIAKLQASGFLVEIHRLTDTQTKATVVALDLKNNTKRIHERQVCLQEV